MLDEHLKSKTEHSEVGRYEEGDLFAVPLRLGGFGICLVARKTERGAALGYFFGPRYRTPPNRVDLSLISADKARLVGWFGDLGILERSWHPLGRLKEWSRDQWPIPEFGRTDALEEEGWKVIYNDSGAVIREVPVDVSTAKSLPQAMLMGASSVGTHLGRLLTSN